MDDSSTTTAPARPEPLDPVGADGVLAGAILTDDGRQDPYSAYARLRDFAPWYRSQLGSIIVTSHDACLEVLRNPKLGRPEPDMDLPASLSGRQRSDLDRSRSMLFANPPDHTRLRSLVSRAFTPRRVEEMRPRIEAILGPFVDTIREQRDVDVLEVLAGRLPATVISVMLGVPAELHDELAHHVRNGTALIDAAADDDAIQQAQQSIGVVATVFDELVDHPERRTPDGLLSALIEVEEAGDRLSREELIANVTLLYAAGFETTTNLIGNGLLALLDHPDELARLRADRSLMSAAVWELLRWDSPVQLNARAALEETEVLGSRVTRGEVYTVLQGSANRDRATYHEADHLDVGRFVDPSTPPPLSFGWGPHHCLGAALARAEGEVVLGGLLDAFDTIELMERPRYRPSFTLRGLESLRVHFA